MDAALLRAPTASEPPATSARSRKSWPPICRPSRWQVVAPTCSGPRPTADRRARAASPISPIPIAVASIMADLGLDAETIIAAILHDTLGTPLTAERNSAPKVRAPPVADLVDGASPSSTRCASARQPREAGRRELPQDAAGHGARPARGADQAGRPPATCARSARRKRSRAPSRARIDIYAPIAQRLGMNRFKAELQELGFAPCTPTASRVIEARIKSALGNRREAMGKIEAALSACLAQEGIPARVVSRIKSPYSIYVKMRQEHKSFAQVMDVVRLSRRHRQRDALLPRLGAVHGLYKPLDGRFRDFVAIPKANGYRSLHTVLFGPLRRAIEIQIRTERWTPWRNAAWRALDLSPTPRRPTRRSRAHGWVEGPGGQPVAHGLVAGVSGERQGRSVSRRCLLVHAQGTHPRPAAQCDRRWTSPTPCTPTSARMPSRRAWRRSWRRCARD